MQIPRCQVTKALNGQKTEQSPPPVAEYRLLQGQSRDLLKSLTGHPWREEASENKNNKC